jgi:aminopeptidase YwaD
VAVLLSVLALTGTPDPGHRFASSLARAGPRPAASAKELRAHERVARRFRSAGLGVRYVRFNVPGKGRSRNVVGVFDTRASCIHLVMAHTDSMPRTPGADDNASGVGVLVALAPRLAAVKTRCDVWLVATGSEERLYTGSPDHLGSLALVRDVKRRGLRGRVRFALSLDEVGSRRSFVLRSPVAAVRSGVEGALLAAARRARVAVGWRRDDGSGNSDHREFQLAGMPGMKLGVADNPCRHEPCDRASRLDGGAFRRARAVVEELLSR